MKIQNTYKANATSIVSHLCSLKLGQLQFSRGDASIVEARHRGRSHCCLRPILLGILSSNAETLTVIVWPRLPSNPSIGMIHLMETLQYKDKSSLQTVFVVKDLKINLLGLPTITALKLAARVDVITDYHAMIEEFFPAVFEGLGNLGECYVIRLLPDV